MITWHPWCDLAAAPSLSVDSVDAFISHFKRRLIDVLYLSRLFELSSFAQSFIDVRESERKRLQRGIITAPTGNRKQNQAVNGEANNGSTSQPLAPSSKAEHLLELQEKITREILSTKLAESEMNALQVSYLC